jgi:hypothetical protein
MWFIVHSYIDCTLCHNGRVAGQNFDRLYLMKALHED